MPLLNWFSTAEAARFGKELASDLYAELATKAGKADPKFAAKAEKSLQRAAQRVQAFKERERMNVLKKAKLANAFLWTLKEQGCNPEYANQLTDWLTMRL